VSFGGPASNGASLKLLDALSKKSSGEDATRFRLLPQLEHLELMDVRARAAKFVDLISARWDAPTGGRSLKTMKLRRCLDPVVKGVPPFQFQRRPLDVTFRLGSSEAMHPRKDFSSKVPNLRLALRLQNGHAHARASVKFC